MMRICVKLIPCLLVFGLAKPAAGRDPSTAAKEKAAKKACAMGDYDRGADILTDLFVETNDITYVFNQARCYEQNSLWDRAIARFREYLRKAEHLTENDRTETERHIADCEAALARVAPPPSPAADPTAAKAPPAALVGHPTSAGGAPPAETSAPASPVAPTGRPGRGLRVAGVICSALGVAAIGGGVGFALKTQSISSNEEKNGPTQAQEDEREKYERWGWVSYGVGAGALAAGVVMYIVGWTRARSSHVAWFPSVGPEGASLVLRGSY